MTSREDIVSEIQDELNPNNMIVSDVLKERLPQEFYDAEEEKDLDIRVKMSGFENGGIEIKAFLKFSSLSESSKGWSLTGTTTKTNALKIIRSSLFTWKSIKIMHGANELIKEVPVSTTLLEMSVEAADPRGSFSNDCLVTLSCLEQ